MTTTELKAAIEKVAKSTGKTEQEIANKIMAKDSWTVFLVTQAAK